MSKIKCKDMKPELLVRTIIHRMGFRFRLHRNDLPGRPDLVFPKKRKVVFVNGCFWHFHKHPQCPISRLPKSNQEYWRPKLEGNAERDLANIRALEELGWEVKVIWECETKDIETLAQTIQDFLGG